MNAVFVLSNTKKPLMPTRPARARKLLTSGRAAVYRLHPFTIILNDRAEGNMPEPTLRVWRGFD
jgi:hypothetical protein